MNGFLTQIRICLVIFEIANVEDPLAQKSLCFASEIHETISQTTPF